MTRPTIPTQLKVVTGTYRTDRAKNEPLPTKLNLLPEAPDFFNEAATKEWFRIGPELLRLNLLTTADLTMFQAYCLSYGRLVKATTALNESDEMFYEYTNKALATNHVARPEIAVIQKETLLLKSLCVEFGLTPSSRGRMQLPESTS